MAKQFTMTEISYGIETPLDLLEKLRHDGEKIGQEPHKFDLFNFFITAASLYEWTTKHHGDHSSVASIVDALKSREAERLPVETKSWVANTDCVPNRHCDVRRHVFNSMQICWQTANACKHYQWLRSSEVQAIEASPKVKSWYQYFTTSRVPGVFVEYAGEYYTVSQIKGILLQFYDGLFRHIAEVDCG